MKNKKYVALALSLPLLLAASIPSASAHCPLCTGAVIAGAVGAKYLGFDVSIIGLFTGAFAISTGIWVAKWASKKFRSWFPYQSLVIVLLSFALTVIPLLGRMNEQVYIPVFLFGESGSALNMVYSLNKFLVGSIVGSIVTGFAYHAHLAIKARRGKVLFPFQGIVLTIVLLILASIPLYFIFR